MAYNFITISTAFESASAFLEQSTVSLDIDLSGKNTALETVHFHRMSGQQLEHEELEPDMIIMDLDDTFISLLNPYETAEEIAFDALITAVEYMRKRFPNTPIATVGSHDRLDIQATQSTVPHFIKQADAPQAHIRSAYAYFKEMEYFLSPETLKSPQGFQAPDTFQ